ncbi:MAG: hypothetical protein Q9162_001490 [Coniocarpon cinnabarinum]
MNNPLHTLRLPSTILRITYNAPKTYNPTPIRPLLRQLTTTRTLRIEAPPYLNDAERQIFDKLSQSLKPSRLDVQDISGGCGSMYGLDIESEMFKGLSVVKQHKMVNEVLKEDVKGWHGVQVKTRVPQGGE